MNSTVHPILDQVIGAWRFRWLAIATATVLALLGWLVIFALPDRYEAVTQVMIDSRPLKLALQGLTTDGDVSPQLNYVRQTLLVDASLCRVAEQVDVLPGCSADLEAAQPRLADLRARIKLDVLGADGGQGYQNDSANVTFKLTYRDTNRARALQLVSLLQKTLEEQTLGGNRVGTQNAQQFLASQLSGAQKQLQVTENGLADFKARHVGLLPTDDGGYASQLQKETQAVEELQTKLLSAQNRRATLARQLQVAAATVTPVVGGTSGAMTVADTASQIAALQAHLDDLLLKYTDKHPDVIAAREQLAELRKRRATEVLNAQRGDAAAVTASGAAASPLYQSIQLQVNQADVDIGETETELAQHQDKVRQLRQVLNSEPQVEAEFGRLSREYESAKAQYAALQANYDKSRLSEQAAAAGDVRFRVVQPPTVSYNPVSPPRSLLLIGALLLALVAGGALAYRLDRFHPVVGSAEALSRLTDLPVLAAVGSAFPSQKHALRQREVRQVSLVVVVLMVALIAGLMLSGAGVRLDVPAMKHAVKTWVS